jgi:hypothetical protein
MAILTISCVSGAATPAPVRNVVTSPISNLLVDTALAALHGAAKTSAVLEAECEATAEGNDRVLVNDLLLATRQGESATRDLVPGPACRVIASKSSSNTIFAHASFRDAWGVFEARLTRPGTWTASSGEVRYTSMMTGESLLSVAAFEGNQVVAFPFRDIRFAMFLIVGDRVTVNTGRSYFASRSFLSRRGFQPADVTLTIPRMTLDSVTSRITEDSVRVSQHVRLAFSEAGSGDAPSLPKAIGKLMPPPGYGLVYAKYRPRVSTLRCVADHPFYFAIVDTQTQARLFEGWIDDPTAVADF